MLRVVFDTVVFVRSLINPHSRWGRAVFLHSDGYRLFLSQPVLAEYLEVLRRPELTRKFRGLAEMDMTEVLGILSRAEVVEANDIISVCRDPNDDKFLATAKAAEADYLVSADDDLLDIRVYEGIEIIDADKFLAILGRKDEG